MSFFFVLAIALALAMDAFAVSVGISLKKQISRSQIFRLSISFGFFQFFMAIVGWYAGQNICSLIQKFDHWVAFGLLLIIGGRMILESFRQPQEEMNQSPDPTRGITLLVLSIATSLDAFAVGLSYAALHVRILYPALMIGIVAACLSFIGSKMARPLAKWIGKKAELAGGLILILIGIKILSEHL